MMSSLSTTVFRKSFPLLSFLLFLLRRLTSNYPHRPIHADLTYLNFVVGVLIMFCVFTPIQTHLYTKDRLKNRGINRPEARFLTSLFTVWGFPMSLFWFAYSSNGNTSYWSPVIAGAILGIVDPLLWLGMLNFITGMLPSLSSPIPHFPSLYTLPIYPFPNSTSQLHNPPLLPHHLPPSIYFSNSISLTHRLIPQRRRLSHRRLYDSILRRRGRPLPPWHRDVRAQQHAEGHVDHRMRQSRPLRPDLHHLLLWQAVEGSESVGSELLNSASH